MAIGKIILKKGEERRLLAGHPWVYDNEVDRVIVPGAEGRTIGVADLESGAVVDVETDHKTYVGRALANGRSKIVARLFSPSKEGLDRGFFKRRLRTALERRREFYDLRRESERIVFAEADFLPGLIIDRFVGWPYKDLPSMSEPPTVSLLESQLGPQRSWITVQFLSFGMDSRRAEILGALEEVFAASGLGPVEGIIERDEARVRELEGLPQVSGIIGGTYPDGGVVIFENGIPFAVDLTEGQKTGHFLDQKENRKLAARFARGKRVLDLCCHTGGFALHAAVGGAREVQAVDVSPLALEAVRKNWALNRLPATLTTVEGDVFEVLRNYERNKEKFDLIVLDPPAFAKSHTALDGAIRGYKEINLRAIKLLADQGTLVTCSCSHAMDEGRFKVLVASAASDAGKRLVLLDFRYQAPDHPILLGYGESLYLKCGFYRLLS